MLSSILRFETGYHMRGAGFVAIFALFFLLVFGAVTVDTIQIGSSEAVNINAPSAIANTFGIMSVFGMFIPVVFMATSVVRDRALKTEEMFGSLPVRPRTMLLGRYVAGLLAAVLCFGAVPLAFYLGSLMPWLDQEKVGPHSLYPVFYYYATIGAMNMLIAGTILFTVANFTRSIIATWVGLVALLVGYFVGLAIAGDLEARETAALLDPFGLIPFGLETRYWTAAEQNTMVAPLSGTLLTNRLIWGGVALALLVLNLAFPKGVRGLSLARFRKTEKSPAAAALRVVDLPRVEPAPLYTSNLQQFVSRTRFEAVGVVRSVAFWIILALSVLNAAGSVFFLAQTFGAQSWPVTRVVITAIEGSFIFVPLVIAAYYTAELVWRERSVKFNEIVDATPTPSWVFVGAKFLAIIVVLFMIALAATLLGVVSQLVRGFTDFELGQYATRFSVSLVLTFGIAAVLAMFLQVIANNKWLGIGLFLAYFVVSIIMEQVGFDHILYNPGGGVRLTYSDMDGYGPSGYRTLVMGTYWTLFCVLVAMLTFALWSRGSLDPIRHRLAQVPSRFSKGSAAFFAGTAILFAGVGGFAYYNTNVLNTYTNRDGRLDRAETYEEKYAKYRFTPLPEITEVDVDAELYPSERRAVIRADYVLKNTTDAPLNDVHVDYGFSVTVIGQEVEGATLSLDDEEFNHYMFTFDEAMKPGETRTMTSTIEIDNPGFSNSGLDSSVRGNGTFLNSSALAQIDWGEGKILQDRAERRKRGLEELPRIPKLEDERYWNVGLLSGADWIDFRIEVTTSADQIAVAPGYLVSDTVQGDRRTFVYEQDVPIQNFYAIQSARYEVEEEVWKAPPGQDDVALQVFYDAKHPYNVERMMEAMKLSFDKFTDVFTPFQYRQMRIQEFPNASFAQSFPNTVPYSENIGFITRMDERTEGEIDPVTYVTAHEVAHQWFGHQLSAAQVQGATMLIESFAQYGAYLVMEDLYGKEHMRRFLRRELDNYLNGRANEPIEELPLYRVENQQYIHYQKGGHVMYLLRDQIGEEIVNSAVRRMLIEWGYKSDPYPRSVDFLDILREEAGPEHEQLITDLFERIVLYDVEVTAATKVQNADGTWDLTLDFDATKLVSDGLGNEKEEDLAIIVDVGAFTEHPKDVLDGEDHIIAFERRAIASGEQTITFTVDQEPFYAGVDPYNKLIDRRPENNVDEVGVTPDGS